MEHRGALSPARISPNASVALYSQSNPTRVAKGEVVRRDAKTALHELLQSHVQPTPRYQILKESGPAHRRNLLVGSRLDGRIASKGCGRGRTCKAAEQSAARRILQALRDLSTE